MSRSHGRSASQTRRPMLLQLLARRGDGRIGRWSTVLLLTLFLGGSASGQPASKIPHIGWLDFWPNCDTSSLESGLRDLGYVPGTSVVIDCRSAGGRYEGLPTAAAELVKLNVDVIVAPSHPTAQAAHPWPPDRKQIDAGTLTINSIESEDTSPTRDINFDPLVLPAGISPSDDPLLSARSAAYSQSFIRREGEHKVPSAVSTAEVEK